MSLGARNLDGNWEHSNDIHQILNKPSPSEIASFESGAPAPTPPNTSFSSLRSLQFPEPEISELMLVERPVLLDNTFPDFDIARATCQQSESATWASGVMEKDHIHQAPVATYIRKLGANIIATNPSPVVCTLNKQDFANENDIFTATKKHWSLGKTVILKGHQFNYKNTELKAAEENTEPKDADLATTKIVIKSANMSEKMQQECLDIGSAALGKYSIDKDIATQIKREIDRRHGPPWQVVVGKDFASHVTHETKHFIHLQGHTLAILIWKL